MQIHVNETSLTNTWRADPGKSATQCILSVLKREQNLKIPLPFKFRNGKTENQASNQFRGNDRSFWKQPKHLS